MRWDDFSNGEKVGIVTLALWWVFGAWLASALGFKDPMFILGVPFIGLWVFMGLLGTLAWALRKFGH